MADETPANFLKELLPGSTTEAVRQNPVGRLKLIAKAAMMSYLASFFDRRGFNRSFLKHVSPTLEGMYDAGHKGLPADESYRRLQIARLFEKTEAHLPAILITDAGARNVPTGLGGYDSAEVDQNTGLAILRTTSAMRISLNLFVGAEDLTTADTICTALGMIFGPIRRLSGGDMITSERYGREQGGSFTPGTWVMHLPQGEVDLPAASHNPHGEDQRSGFYTATMTISDIYLEASSWWQYDHRPRRTERDLLPDVEANLSKAYSAQLPDIDPIPLGRSVRIDVRYMPVGAQLYVSNRNVAVIRNGFELVARGLGEATLRIVAPGTDESRVLDEKPFQVVWR